MVRVTIRPGMHHREGLRGGDIVDVSEAELAAFGDKFIVLGEQPELKVEPAPEPHPLSDDGPWAGLDATDGAISLAEEHGVNLCELSGTGAGGRILKRDVAEAINGGP